MLFRFLKWQENELKRIIIQNLSSQYARRCTLGAIVSPSGKQIALFKGISKQNCYFCFPSIQILPRL